jgi:hypothetical protein
MQTADLHSAALSHTATFIKKIIYFESTLGYFYAIIHSMHEAKVIEKTISQNPPATDENMDFLNLETQQTQSAIDQARTHAFNFGYEYAFKQGLIQAAWSQNKIHFQYDGANENDPVWFGNCVDDARCTYQFLKSRVGVGASIAIQRMQSSRIGGFIKSGDHYRVLVEHHASPHSILSEIDHSELYSRIFTGDQTSVYNWYEVNDQVYFFPNNKYVLESGQLNPYCELLIDNRAYIIFFLVEVSSESIAVTMWTAPLLYLTLTAQFEYTP